MRMLDIRPPVKPKLVRPEQKRTNNYPLRQDHLVLTEVQDPGSSLMNSSRPGGGFDETGEVPVPLQYVVLSLQKT